MAIAFRAATAASIVSGTSITVNKPAGTVDNDVMILAINARTGTGFNFTPPAGWTSIRKDTEAVSPAETKELFRKVASGEPADYAITISASVDGCCAAILSFSGVDTTNPIDVDGGNFTDVDTTINRANSITTTVADTMIITTHCFPSSGTDGSAWTPPSGMTEAIEKSSNATGVGGITIDNNFVLQPAIGATGDKDASMTGNDNVEGLAQILALKPSAVTLDFTVDALLQTPSSNMWGNDAFVQQQNNDETFTTDAKVVNRNTTTFTVDAIVVERNDNTFTVDAKVVNLNTNTFTNDALLQVTQTNTFIVDANVQLATSNSFSIDALLLATQTLAFAVDGRLIDRRQTTVELDARLINRNTNTFTVNAIIVNRNTNDFTVDANVQATQTNDFIVDANVQLASSVSFEIDALLLVTQTLAFTVDSKIIKRRQTTVELDAKLIARNTETLTVDAILATTKLNDFTINALLEFGFVDNDFTVDAFIGAQVVTPDADISNAGGWVPQINPTLFQELDNIPLNLSQFIRFSGSAPIPADSFEVSMGDMADPNRSDGHVITIVVRANTPGPVVDDILRIRIKLFQDGVTLIVTTPFFLIPSASVFTTLQFTLTGAEADAITNYLTLSFRGEPTLASRKTNTFSGDAILV